MGMSYRHAWLMVQSVNEAAGTPFVVASTGGSRGGGAQLTAAGQRALALFRSMQEQLHQAAENLSPRKAREPRAGDAIHVAAAVSLAEVLGQLLGDYALAHPDLRVRTLLGGSDEIADHLLAGAPADLFLTADPRQLDRLEAAGLVEPGARTPFAENSLAAVGLAGGDVAVRRPADLAHAGRVALADPTCPLGGYTRAYLENLGLYEALAGKTVLVENSRAVLAAVRGSQAEVGLVYGSDVRDDGCRLLFRAQRLPIPIQYTAAVLLRGQRTDQAHELLHFLSSGPAAARFRRCGFAAPR